MSIYLLVFMSVDRYLAVVHAVDSMSNYRTAKNTTICIGYDCFFSGSHTSEQKADVCSVINEPDVV